MMVLLIARKAQPGAATLAPAGCSLPMRRFLTPLVALALLAAPGSAPEVAAAPADSRAAQVAPAEEVALRARLGRSMRLAGPASGAYVRNATDRRTLFRWRAGTPRALASNTKLFTTAAVLDRLGSGGTLPSTALAGGPVAADGTLTGDLVLRGGGDPTFGSATFVRRSYGTGAEVEALAERVAAAGVRRVSGRVIGDESRFDALRGGPDSGYRASHYVGALSALAFNRGLANEFGSAFQALPPAFAAGRLDAALEARGVTVAEPPRAGVTPPGAAPVAEVRSPPMARLVQITNTRSDNFFAEMLLKNLGAAAEGAGTTAAGARAGSAFASRLGARAVLADGSGLSRANRASPAAVARLLGRMRPRATFPAFSDSLAVAGQSGTLSGRMRSGPARGRCRAKTGTLAGVSALSGYCTARTGDVIEFSFLMNGVYAPAARRLQDRMAQALAAYRG